MVNFHKIAHLTTNVHINDIKSFSGNTFTMIIIVMKLFNIINLNYLRGIVYILQEKNNPDM